MNRPRLRIGVAGGGRWGVNIVRTLDALGLLGAVFDADPATREALGKHFPHAAMAADFEGLLAGSDAVAIAAPAQLHAELAARAIDAGRHVFVEKPLCFDLSTAESLVKTARSKGVVLMAGHLLLYHPAVRRLLRSIDAGDIGDVLHVRSRRLAFGRVRDVENVWWSFAPHDVSLILAVMGSMPLSIRSIQRSIRGSLADFAEADYEFSGKRTAHVEVSWLDPVRVSRLDVFGSTGILSFDDSAVPALTRIPIALRGGPTKGEPELLSFDPTPPLRRELEAFSAAILDGAATYSDGRAAIDVVAVLAASQDAALGLDQEAALA